MILFGFNPLKCWFLFLLSHLPLYTTFIILLCFHNYSNCNVQNCIFFSFSAFECVFYVIFQYMTSTDPSLYAIHDYLLFLFPCLSTFILISRFHIILLCFVTFLAFMFSNWFTGWRRAKI